MAEFGECQQCDRLGELRVCHECGLLVCPLCSELVTEPYWIGDRNHTTGTWVCNSHIEDARRDQEPGWHRHVWSGLADANGVRQCLERDCFAFRFADGEIVDG